jgi:hypothetical protein
MSERDNFKVDTMARRDRLRRVVLLCCSFGRNLAYYRAGREQAVSALLASSHPDASFWRQANSSFLYVAMLEWSKLIGDKKKGKHNWHNIVTNPASFEAELLTRLGMTTTTFADHIKKMHHYRNKFVAHLDSDYVMHIPDLTAAKTAVWFYHEHVVTNEVEDLDLVGLPDTADKMVRGYAQCLKEAGEVFGRAMSSDSARNHHGA